MQNALLYLASPFSHLDPAVRERRFQAACRVAAELTRKGRIVFSPIVYSYSLCQHGLPLDWEFWQPYDLAFLAMCEEVVVLKLDGWEQSIGIQGEIAAAKALGKRVSFVDASDEVNGSGETSLL